MPAKEKVLGDMKLADVLNTPSGRFVLARLLRESGVDGTSYRSDMDAHYTSFREGQRSMGRFLTDWMIRVNLDGYLKLWKEEILAHGPGNRNS